MAGDGTETNMDSIELPYFEVPHFQWPDIAIGIESIYGMGGVYGPLTGITFDRKDDEDNEALAKRIASEMEQFILGVLNDNEQYRADFEKRKNK